MTRRGSLLALIGTVILLVSLSVPMMQCAPAGEEEVAPPEEEVAPPTEEIKYGGRLNIGFTRPIDTLAADIKQQYSEWGCLHQILVYDNLAHYGIYPDTYTFWPKLVKSYEVSEDGTTWTLHLVENATWHDGVPFTAEDVAFTFEYLFQTPGWGGPLTTFEDIDVIDDYTIKVVHEAELSTANIPGWWLWHPVISKHIFEPYKDDILSFQNEESIGTGALKLKENKFEQYEWLVTNEDYWGERPYVDEVIFRSYGSLDPLLMALESGEVDVFGDLSIPPLALEDIKANPDIKVETMPGVRLNYLTFNLHADTPLQNKDVRHAILYGIDRDRLVDMAYGGYAKKYDGWIYTESQMHNPDLPQYDYNPDKANEILDGAGYMDTDGDGIRNDPTTGENFVFDLMASSGEPPHVKMCTLIGEMLPEIGIHVDFRALDSNTFLDLVCLPEDDAYEIALNYQSPSPDPWSDWIWGLLRTEGNWNTAYYDNPHYNELWFDNSCAKDLESKKEILYEMQEILAEDLPYAWLTRPDYISAYRTDKLEGWVNAAGGPISWFNDWSILKVHLK